MKADTSSDAIATVVETARAEYSFTSISSVTRNPNTWAGRIVLTFEADGSRYLLKEYPWFSRTGERIAFSLSVQDFVRSAGLPVPGILETQTGQKTFPLEEQVFFVQPIVGRGFEPGNRHQRQNGLRMLGRLHGVSTRFPMDSIPDSVRCTPTSDIDGVRAYFASMRDCLMTNAGSDVDRSALAAVFRPIARHVEEAADALLALPPDAFPSLVRHGDFQHFNLRFEANRVVAIVDWDAPRHGFRLLELAKAIVLMFGTDWDSEYARDRAWRSPPRLDTGVLDECVALYEEDGPELDDVERSFLPHVCLLVGALRLAGFYQQPFPSPAGAEQPSDAEACRNLLAWMELLRA